MLNYWSNNYSNFIVGNSNRKVYNFIFNNYEHILLKGPAKSGKKHLTFLAKNYVILNLNENNNELSIINLFDSCKLNNKKILCIFKNQKFSSDVISRLNFFIQLEIEELTLDIFQKFLIKRLNDYGIAFNSYLLNYCLIRLNCTYLDVDKFINYLILQPYINFHVINNYFNL